MSDNRPIPGGRDRIDREVLSVQALQSRLQRHLASYGYQPVDVPLLERADLYLRKLGSQVAALMFTVTDHRGDRLALRPEFTGSVVRCYINQAADLALPVRWQYTGPVFRDREPAGAALRQFTQFGCELIGAAGPRADAELLAAAADSLRVLGAPNPRLVIGHAGLAPALLAGLELSERARIYITSHLDLVRSGPDGLERLQDAVMAMESAAIPDAAEGPRSASATSLIEWFLDEHTTRPTGRRSSEQIVRRFRQKVMGVDTPERLERGLALVRALSEVTASPSEALNKGERILKEFQLPTAPLQALRDVLERLEAYDLGGVEVKVDLGLHRPLGYYTGMVFELYASADGPVVGGGGRYDGLVRALGGDDVATLGFAFELERLEQELTDGTEAAPPPGITLVASRTEADFPAAVAHAAHLRASGQVVEVETTHGSEDLRVEYCRARGIAKVVLVSAGSVREIAVAPERQYV